MLEQSLDITIQHIARVGIYVDFIVYIFQYLSLSRLYFDISCQETSTIFVIDNNWKI